MPKDPAKINTLIDNDLTVTEEDIQLQEDIDELPEDIQEALGLEDKQPSTKNKKGNKTPEPDLDYLSEEDLNALEEIDELV